MSAWQLNESQIATIIPKLQSKTTAQLLQIWNTEILSEYRSEENLEAVRRVLAQRGTTPPTRWQVWFKTNAVPLLVCGAVGMVILPDILSKLLQDKPVAPASIFALAAVVFMGWLWIRQSRETLDLLAAEPEPGQTILRKQMQAYRVITALLPLWGFALFKFGLQARFSLLGVEVSLLPLFGSLFLLPLGYISASAIKYQILLYYPKGGGVRVARGNWARAGAAFFLCLYLAFWLFWLFAGPQR